VPRAERRKLSAARYLSRSHRDHPETGCPLPRLAGEAPEAGADFRQAFARAVQGELESSGAGADPQSLAQEIALMALAVGGLALARAVPGQALSDQILRACRDAAGQLADAYEQR